MIKQRGFCFILALISVLLLCTQTIHAAGADETLFSQNTAAAFITEAQALYRQAPLDARHVDQSMTFLSGALELDQAAKAIPEQILVTGAGSCASDQDYGQMLLWAMDRYIDDRADLEVIAGAIRCMLDKLNSRVDREVLLEQLHRKYGSKNKAMASELMTHLGLLAVEKADMETAIQYFSEAYSLNPYNPMAFLKMQEAASVQGMTLNQSALLTQMRIAVDVNPYSLAVVLMYAQSLKQLELYDLASAAYEYAANLYQFLYPDQPLDEAILYPWLMCCYSADRMETKCIEITETYRDPKRFELMLEALAGKAIVKLGEVEEGKEILEMAAGKAERLLSVEGLEKPIYPEDLAWFYSFILDMPDKALAWSNEAFQDAPGRRGVQAMFAYTLAVNGQYDLAEKYAQPLKENEQVAALTVGLVQLSQKQQTAAVESLRNTVAMAPETFIAEKAIRTLKNNGSDYVQDVSISTLRDEMTERFEMNLVPGFILPEKRFNAKLLFNGSTFIYGADFSPRLVIENISTSPLIIGTDGLLNGRVRIDAVVKGNLNVDMPDLLTFTFRPSKPILPGEYISVPVDLNSGPLNRLLLTYPQADIDIHFTAYLDPVIDVEGQIINAIKGTQPATGDIKRTRVTLTRDLLMQRLDVLAKGKQGQRLAAVKFFTGLLAEQKAFEQGQADFRHVQIDATLLVDSVRKTIVDEDWKVRIQTMDSLFHLQAPLNAELIADISENLNHEKWPVRLMAQVLLAKTQPASFQKVLDWAAQFDPYWVNRRMALSLGAAVPKPVQNEPET